MDLCKNSIGSEISLLVSQHVLFHGSHPIYIVAYLLYLLQSKNTDGLEISCTENLLITQVLDRISTEHIYYICRIGSKLFFLSICFVRVRSSTRDISEKPQHIIYIEFSHGRFLELSTETNHEIVEIGFRIGISSFISLIFTCRLFYRRFSFLVNFAQQSLGK